MKCKFTVEPCDNGFIMEHDVYTLSPGREAYTVVVSSVTQRRVIASNLEDVFEEIRKVYV